jgi:hypothetical protein
METEKVGFDVVLFPVIAYREELEFPCPVDVDLPRMRFGDFDFVRCFFPSADDFKPASNGFLAAHESVADVY